MPSIFLDADLRSLYVHHGQDLKIQDEQMTFALKAQNQMLRTALAWKKLKSETEIKRKIIRYFAPEKKTDGTN